MPVCNRYQWLVDLQVNDAFSVEKGDTALAFTSRDRVSAEEVRSLMLQNKDNMLYVENPCYAQQLGLLC